MSQCSVSSHYKTRKHYSFDLPTELNDVPAGLPLYLLVALWALRQNRPVSVRDVRGAFKISLRRASDILEYIAEQGERNVKATCFLRPLRQGDRRMRREWHVTAVSGVSNLTGSRSTSPATISPRVIRKIHIRDSMQELRQWFLLRSSGNVVPDELLDQK